MGQSVELGDTVCWDCNLSLQVLVDVNEIGDTSSGNNNLVELSSENCLHLIEQWSASSAQWSWKLREFHGVSGAPEVALLSEVLLAQILNTKCDIVIGYAA